MTSTLAEDLPPAGEWTADDLDALPEDGRHYELIDGVLIVTPSPGRSHQRITDRLCAALDDGCPTEYEVLTGLDVRISNRRSLTPDVLVAVAEVAGYEPARLTSRDVLLAVEVVSPSSVTMDRITKPALYAAAGIPYYWRIEQHPDLGVHAYRLDPVVEVYVPVGTFTDAITVDEPWQIRIPLDRLVRRPQA